MKQNTTMNEIELKVELFKAITKNATDFACLFRNYKDIAQRVNIIYDTLNNKH